jgi:hypothetical protein
MRHFASFRFSLPLAFFPVAIAVAGGGGCGSSAATQSDGSREDDAAAALRIACGAADPGVLDFLDNMEDGDMTILGRDGRVANWYTFHDATAGTITPAPMANFTMETIADARCGISHRAMRVTGSGFGDWGSVFGFAFKSAFVNGAWVNLPYDTSTARGISFWARAGETSITSMHFGISDQWSDPYGGHCDVSLLSGPTSCYDHFGARFELTTTWQRFTYSFGELQQRSFGIPRPSLDQTTTANVEFNIPPSAPVFDIWIDDVALYH